MTLDEIRILADLASKHGGMDWNRLQFAALSEWVRLMTPRRNELTVISCEGVKAVFMRWYVEGNAGGHDASNAS